MICLPTKKPRTADVQPLERMEVGLDTATCLSAHPCSQTTPSQMYIEAPRTHKSEHSHQPRSCGMLMTREESMEMTLDLFSDTAHTSETTPTQPPEHGWQDTQTQPDDQATSWGVKLRVRSSLELRNLNYSFDSINLSRGPKK